MGCVSRVFVAFRDVFDEFGGVFDEFGVSLEQELEDEFEGDVDAFDEFGGAFVVCLLSLGVRSFCVSCMYSCV